MKVPFAHQLTHTKHMESVPPNLIILTKKKKSCYSLKWNTQLLQGAGNADVGTLAAPAGPFPISAPRPQPRLPPHLQRSRLSLCTVRAGFVFPPSHQTPWPPPSPSLLCFSGRIRRPALSQPLLGAELALSTLSALALLCAQNIPLLHLGLAPVSCHPIVPRPPTLRCLFYFLHRISC